MALAIAGNEENAQALLEADQELFVLLSQAAALSNTVNEKIKAGELTEAQQQTARTYFNQVRNTQDSLVNRQKRLKDAANISDDDTEFFGLDAIKEFASDVKTKIINVFNKGLSFFGLGILPLIPLAIFAVTAIVAAISAVVITDMLTDSTKEKERLLKSSAEICEQLELSKAQCRSIIEQTIKGDGGLFEGFFKPRNLIIGAGILLLFMNRKPIAKALKIKL